MDPESAAENLYRDLIDGWNGGDADAMSAVLTAESLVVGFDGSQLVGRAAVTRELGRIFADHPTARYVTKVRSVRSLGPDAGIVYAVAFDGDLFWYRHEGRNNGTPRWANNGTGRRIGNGCNFEHVLYGN